jgi:glucan phosphoethanolaminetransferase (alkaline phosphatase superfamily)
LLWRYRKKWVLNFFLLFSFFLACYLAFTSKHTTYPFNEASHLFYVIVIIGVISLFKWRSIWAFLKRLAFVLRAIIKGIAKGFRFVGRGFTKVNTKVKEVNERLDELAQEVENEKAKDKAEQNK